MAVSDKLQVILEAIGGGAVISEFNKVGNAAKKAYGDTSVAAKDAATGTGVLDRAASGISGKLKTLGVDANVTGGMLKAGIAVGATAAGAAAIKFGADSVQAFANATGSVRAFQRVSGATAEDSSKLVAAMKQLGIDSDAGATSVFRLARNVADHRDKLLADGIAVEQNKNGQTDLAATLMNVADAYNATQDPAQKAKIVFDAFGRSGASMIPILERGRTGLKDLFAEAGKSHEIFSQADLEKGRQFSLATAQLGEAFKGLEIEIGSGLVPEVTNLTRGITDFIHAADSATKSVTGFVGSQQTIGDVVGNVVSQAFGQLPDLLGLVSSGQKKGAETAAQQAAATKQAADAANQAADANAKEEKAIDGVINASISAVSSTLGLERATASEADAVNTYNTALAANTAAHGQNADAAKVLQVATLDTKDAMVNEAGAAVKLAQDQATAKGETLSAGDAARIFHDKLIELADTVQGPLHDQLINLANTVNTLPNKEIEITLNTSGIAGQINYINSQLQGIAAPDRVFTGGGASFKAEGGLISSATLAVVGEAGPELILPLTKPTRMAQLLEQANLLTPFATPSLGGSRGSARGSGATVVNINVAGSVTTEHDLVAAVRKGILNTKRRNGDAGLS